MEVKSRTSSAYDLPVMSARKHLNTSNIRSIINLYEVFVREREGLASGEDIALAQEATHYYHAKELGGIHCVQIENCMNRQSSISRSLVNAV